MSPTIGALKQGAPCLDPLAQAIFPMAYALPRYTPAVVVIKALIDAGVDVLFGALPCGVVNGAAGEITGAIIAHRSGRSAIQARHIIDASMSASFARLWRIL